MKNVMIAGLLCVFVNTSAMDNLVTLSLLYHLGVVGSPLVVPQQNQLSIQDSKKTQKSQVISQTSKEMAKFNARAFKQKKNKSIAGASRQFAGRSNCK